MEEEGGLPVTLENIGIFLLERDIYIYILIGVNFFPIFPCFQRFSLRGENKARGTSTSAGRRWAFFRYKRVMINNLF